MSGSKSGNPMLSPAEADLASRDAALPGLATVLDPDAFLAALREAVPAPELKAARVEHVKYRPEKYCRALYHVDVGGAECDLDVQACRSEDIDSRLWQEGSPAVGTLLGPGRLVLRDAAVLVTVFPNDTKLEQVPKLTDPRGRASLLREVLPDRPELWHAEI